MLTPILIFYVLLAGVGFGLMTIVYRLGQLRGVPVQPIIFIVSLAGVAYTVARTWPDPFWLAPWPVWALGIGIGLSQYLLVMLIATALRHGPLSPLNCAMFLGFVLITGMSLLRLCASLPAAFTVPVVALTLILGGALVSVFFLGERTTRAWWAMMASGTIAGGCLIADALIKAGQG